MEHLKYPNISNISSVLNALRIITSSKHPSMTGHADINIARNITNAINITIANSTINAKRAKRCSQGRTGGH